MGDISVSIDIIQIILAIVFISLLIGIFYLLDYKENKIDRKEQKVILCLVVSLFVVASIILVINGLSILSVESWHLGTLLGVPALFLVSIGTILVLYDEPKYVLYHGLLAGSSWILTLLNVIALFWITPARAIEFSGSIHTIHIVCGGIGMVTGLLSLLFGISGQRKYAKFTGYATIILWWGAFLLGPFIPTL